MGSEKLMQMQKVRVIMNREGICRLEPAGACLMTKPLRKSTRLLSRASAAHKRDSVYTGATPRIADPLRFTVHTDASGGGATQQVAVNMVPLHSDKQ